MTLLEMLADGLDMWPYGELIYATQDSDGEIWFSETLPTITDDGYGTYWTSTGLRVCSFPYYHYNGINADDYSVAIVTMSQWEKERRKLKKNRQTKTANSADHESSLKPPLDPTADTLRPHIPPLSCLSARDYLYSVHLDWTRNYVAIEKYAANNSINIVEATVLIALASNVAKLYQPAE